ncbi:hypothetical protein EPN90_00240 [Patescibacteria group bacterium]|nr:MAG: hypothetical protein EPN90_00240 [Patescibacteria group bacterium]
MTFRQYLVAILVGTAAALGAALVILFNVNPEEAGAAATAALLLSLGIALTGLLAITRAVLRLLFGRRASPLARHARVSFRQSSFVALLLIIALILSHLNLLAWWSILLAVGALSVTEYFFLSSENYVREGDTGEFAD